MATTASCTGIISNPDLAGIGVRINLHGTILLAAIIPPPKDDKDKGYKDELLDSLYLNAIFYGPTLLITALVQTIQRQLDLYHGIIVMQMVLSLQILHGFGMRRYILAQKAFSLKMKLTIAIQILSLLIFYPWSFYVWINASRFGPQPECNDLVKFVLVFYTFRATVLWARYLCMTILAMTTFSLLCYLVVIFIVLKVHEVHEVPSGGETGNEGNFWKRLIERLTKVLVCFVWVLSILAAVVCVANTELTVRRNKPNVQAGEGTWGFGQIVSVILILPSVIEIWVALDKRLSPSNKGSGSKTKGDKDSEPGTEGDKGSEPKTEGA
ncbi:hypothetical protein BJY52DRAFT_1364694 [Lactarius psammicola]|nr:hypothetical protein BJY52DRAFT_1364694 [Lactarius psammicola]